VLLPSGRGGTGDARTDGAKVPALVLEFAFSSCDAAADRESCTFAGALTVSLSRPDGTVAVGIDEARSCEAVSCCSEEGRGVPLLLKQSIRVA
jgi:hypothetical protein